LAQIYGLIPSLLGQTQPRRSGTNIGLEECWAGVDPFLFYFLGWVEPDPAILIWVRAVQPTKQRRSSPLFICRTVEQQKKNEEEERGGWPGGGDVVVDGGSRGRSLVKWGGRKRGVCRGKFFFFPCLAHPEEEEEA